MPVLKKILVLLFVLVFLGVKKVDATCEMTASTQSLQANSEVTFQLSLKNTSADYSFAWIKLPVSFGSSFTSVQTLIQASGWTTTTGSDFNIIYGGDLPPGETAIINVLGRTGSAGSFNWSYQAATNPDGSKAESCNSLDFTIMASVPTVTPTPAPPTISGLVASVEPTRATISWQTDSTSNTLVNYGTTTGYGASAVNSDLVTNHQITLNNLSPSTTYHFRATSTNANGTTNSSDSTFTTTAASSAVVVTVTSAPTPSPTLAPSPTPTLVPTPTPKPLVDTVAPVISINTDFSKPFSKTPIITGNSVDGGDIRVGVMSLDYSIDGGKNWLPVDNTSGLGRKSVDFQLVLGKFDDGNYLIKFRAKDSTGNVGFSQVSTMVIDRLPPQVGGSLFSLGPMILKPDSKGNIFSVAGMELRVTLSAVGGPTMMDLMYGSQKFPMIRNDESGLWKGNLGTSEGDSFDLSVHAVDGANNETTRSIGAVVALAPGRVVDEKNSPILKAKIKVYVFEKTLNDFVLWESLPYLQTNPQETDIDGRYRLLLPEGKYFLEVEAAGKRKLRSEIFEIDEPTPVDQNFKMEKSLFGNWWSKVVPISLVHNQSEGNLESDLIGRVIPNFDLSIGDNVLSSFSVLGRQTIITFVSSWEPQTSDQLVALDQFKSENEGVNVFTVMSQDSVSKTDIFKKIGGYKISMVADPDGILVKPFNLGSLPTHIFLDRKGIIKGMSVGFLNKNSLLKRILN